MDILSQSALLVAIISFSLGAATLARSVRNKLFLSFAVLCAAISAWAFSFFLSYARGWEFFYQVHLFINIWLGPISLGFIRLLIRTPDRVSRYLFTGSTFLAFLLTSALFLGLDGPNLVLQFIYFSPGVIVIQIARLMWLDHKIKRGARLQNKVPTVGLEKRNLIYIGALLTLCTCTLDHIPRAGEILPTIGNVALTVYLFFLSQAITQLRLLNFQALLSRFLVLAFLAFMLTAVYALLITWIDYSPPLMFLNSFFVSFLILMLLDPLRSVVRYFTQRLLTKEHRRLEQVIRDSQRKLVGIVDTGPLFTAILQTVEQILDPQRVSLYVLGSDGTRYRRVRVWGTETLAETEVQEEPVVEVIANHGLLLYCQVQKRKGALPVALDQMLENEIDRSASRTQKEHLTALLQSLKALRCNLLIPLFDEGQILGFVAMEVISPPEAWGGSWSILTLIYPYFEQAAQTLRNMEVYVRRREKERLATIGEMAAGLAHEIRNPLGAIKGAAQYLDPSQDKPESRFLQVIIEEVDRLNRVVTQFLDYSKPHGAEFSDVDLVNLTERTVEFVTPSVPKGIHIQFEKPKSPLKVHASSEQIRQVLLNLIQNSFKALEGRSQAVVKISLDTGQPMNSEPQVLLTVEDNGPGIRKENLEKLFIPFFTTSPGGTGLGLSICQKIIEAHRGRIEVASEEERYTKFILILPQARNKGEWK